MRERIDPCVICEKHMEGVVCDEHECPVAMMKKEFFKLETELQVMRGAANSLKMHLQTARAEAIKEFAEKVKENQRAIFNTIYSKSDYCKIIDKLVRETMEGD